MKKLFFLLFLFSSSILMGQPQFTRYLIKLKDKNGTPYTFANPTAYLSQKAIDRRTMYGISLDSTDLPPTPSYINQIRNVPNVTILNISRWQNSVSIQTSDAAALTTISGFPFVLSVSGIAARQVLNSPINKFDYPLTLENHDTGRPSQVEADYYNYGTNSFLEIRLHNGQFLHNIGLRGQGMVIGLLDAGFFNYTTLRAFDSVNMNGQVLSTWDFVDRHMSVIEDNVHGMHVFSTIAANIPGEFVGKAPKANFHLFRTEDVGSEHFIEEHNWVCGAERADSSGCDVLSSSLGYTTFDIPDFDHPYAERNGNIAMATIGADLAAKKGILVFNAVGNILDASTHFLSVPADGDSVVAVGSVARDSTVASNSSFGPSADGQVKPNVASVGVSAVVQSSSGNIGSASGTSFACPNMAGLTTCLWQGFPEYNNMKIVNTIQRASHKFLTPDDRVGYGIPDMKTAFGILVTEYATSSATINSCTTTVSWTSKDVEAMKYEIERQLPGEISFTKIGEVNPSAGSLLSIHNYQFVNPVISPQAGTISYRIRQIIDTSSASFRAVYIDTCNVSISAGCFATGNPDPVITEEKITLQPNPVSASSTTLVIETPYASSQLTILMYDAKGRMVYQLKSSKGPGKTAIPLPTEKLPAGKYYVKVLHRQNPVGSAELIRQ